MVNAPYSPKVVRGSAMILDVDSDLVNCCKAPKFDHEREADVLSSVLDFEHR